MKRPVDSARGLRSGLFMLTRKREGERLPQQRQVRVATQLEPAIVDAFAGLMMRVYSEDM